MAVRLETKHLQPFLEPGELAALAPAVAQAHRALHSASGAGKEFLGWLTLPTGFDSGELARIQAAAGRVRAQSQVLVVVGIGGSYLGARAAIECLTSPLYNNLKKDGPDIYFVGNSLSSAWLCQVLSLCQGRDVSVNVISKSGTTTEPAVAFRIFKEYLENRYGREEARKRIFCTTDRARGTLKELADREGYESFVVPDDVGGRYSVLTPVGLLPIAAAGIAVEELLEGAARAQRELDCEDLEENDCYRYAAIRNLLYRKGKKVELLVNYEPRMNSMAQWFIQLFGESEGKEGKGIFPAAANFTTDLHSMGQYIQQGERMLFETVLDIASSDEEIFIAPDPENFDGLNFLAGQNLSAINRKAMEGTLLAHSQGGVPCMVLEMPCICPGELGYLIYFLEKACAISSYLLGVNPFDQPGVEDYKRNMFALLGKPGYEERRAQLEEKLCPNPKTQPIAPK